MGSSVSAGLGLRDMTHGVAMRAGGYLIVCSSIESTADHTNSP